MGWDRSKKKAEGKASSIMLSIMAEETRQKMIEDDEITATEEGFMRG